MSRPKAPKTLRFQPAGGERNSLPVGKKQVLNIERLAHDGRGKSSRRKLLPSRRAAQSASRLSASGLDSAVAAPCNTSAMRSKCLLSTTIWLNN